MYVAPADTEWTKPSLRYRFYSQHRLCLSLHLLAKYGSSCPIKAPRSPGKSSAYNTPARPFWIGINHFSRWRVMYENSCVERSLIVKPLLAVPYPTRSTRYNHDSRTFATVHDVLHEMMNEWLVSDTIWSIKFFFPIRRLPARRWWPQDSENISWHNSRHYKRSRAHYIV